MDMALSASIQVLVLLLLTSFLQAVTIAPLPFLGYGFNVRPGGRPGRATFLGDDEANRIRRGGDNSNTHRNQIGTGYSIKKTQPGSYGRQDQTGSRDDYGVYKAWGNGGNQQKEYYPKYNPQPSSWDDNGNRNRREFGCEPGRNPSAGHGYVNNHLTPNLHGGGGGGGAGWAQGTGDAIPSGTSGDGGYWNRGSNGNWNSGGGNWNSGGANWNAGGGNSGNWNDPGGNNRWYEPGDAGGGGKWNGAGGSGGWGGNGGTGWTGDRGGSWNGNGGNWGGGNGGNWGGGNGGNWGGNNWSGGGGGNWNSGGGSGGDSIPEGTVGFYGRTRRD